MVDVKPLEWLLMNMTRFEGDDTVDVVKPVVGYIIAPSVSTYVIAGMILNPYLKAFKPGGKVFLLRLSAQLITSILTMDTGYYLGQNSFLALRDKLKIKYS